MKDRKGQHKKRLIFGLTCLIVLVVIASLYVFLQSNEKPLNPIGKKAAIIDGLSTTYKNTTFWRTAQDILQQAGYITYYSQGGADTVSFYRSLPTKGFEIIILRVHSAINPENGELAIFTNEKYSDAKASTVYLNDILNDRLARVRVEEDSPSYFGLTPNFIKAMNGEFENTIIIMMGCDGLTTQSMAKAFIEKGAKAYIGWNGPVTPKYVDSATIKLLKHLIIEEKAIPEAVKETAKEMGDDPYYRSKICAYLG